MRTPRPCLACGASIPFPRAYCDACERDFETTYTTPRDEVDRPRRGRPLVSSFVVDQANLYRLRTRRVA